jgi:hypothetical protein
MCCDKIVGFAHWLLSLLVALGLMAIPAKLIFSLMA